MEEYAKRIENLRADIMLAPSDDPTDAFAEQHFIAALAALEMAARSMKLAQLHETRAIAELQRNGHF